METVRCVFGSAAQKIMEDRDPGWCSSRCGRISTTEGDCYWRFMSYGIDPECVSAKGVKKGATAT